MKAGLEIHQQLKTGKLFCRCPPRMRDDQPDIVIRRRLRPVASETGARDAVSETEAAKNKTFIYEAYSDSTCLVETDDEPPRGIDADALAVAASIAKALNCRTTPELHTMRKAIIDGSCPAGFQRTALLGKDGWLEVGGKKIGIESVCIEEDAGRIIASDELSTTFRLDRLGIPLVEIATAPDISSPDEAREVAAKIGAILRLSGRVVRGLGSIRQDLNVSVEGGARVEIKGVQMLDSIPALASNEVARQEALIRIAGKYRFAQPGKEADVTAVFASTGSKVLAGRQAFALAFPGLAGLMKEELHEGKRFGKEVAERVRVLTRAKGFFHTDELPAYGVTEAEVAALKDAVGAKDKDLVVLVAEERKALKAISYRIMLAAEGVLRETRRANPDDSTSFLRPIAGSARFYPETDVAPVATGELIEKAGEIPSPEARLAELKKLGLSDNLAKGLLLSEDYPLFSSAIAIGVQPTLAATIVQETLPFLRRKGVGVEGIRDGDFERLFSAIAAGKIIRDAVPAAIESLAKGEGLPESEPQDFSEEIGEIVRSKKDFISQVGKDRAMSGLMGEVMAKLRGKLDGAKARELILAALAEG